MFILVQPMYSKQELNADSNYVVYTSLIAGMEKVRPDWHFIVIFPDAKSDFRYEDDGFFKRKNVTRVPQRIPSRKMANAITFDGNWYDAFFRNFGVDAVWCNLVEIADKIRYAGESSYEDVGRQAVVAAHNYVIHETLPYPFEAQAHVAMAQLTGAIHAHHNVFNSDWCQSMLRDNALRWFNEETVQAIFKKSSRIDYGTLEDGLTICDPQNEIPVIAYNHRLQAYKNWGETFAILQELWDEGKRFRVRYMNNTNENITKLGEFPFVEICLSSNRKEYLAYLRGCDLNITNSQHETFCISAIESMALGQPLIAPQSITFPEITGQKTNGYPYLFQSRNEQKAMIRSLLNDAGERKRWGTVLSAHVRSSYNNTLWAERYAALFESLTDYKFNIADDTMQMFLGALRRASGTHVRNVYNEVSRARTPDGRQPYSNQSLPIVKLVRLARSVGARVEMKNGEQVIHYG